MKFKSLRRTILITSLLAIVMFGFSFALVPLYNVLCKKTGFNNNIRMVPTVVGLNKNKRAVLIQFLTTKHQELDWDFYPYTTHIQVNLGETIKILFFAKNRTKKTVTVQAVPSFAPAYAAQYFNKLECFCFTQQTLKRGETIYMPVIFQIDEKLPTDIHTITLSYTLFAIQK